MDGKNIVINIVVPRIAKSAGTLLALLGDKILLTPMSELGPLDPQIPSERGVYISAKTVRDSLRQLLDLLSEMSESEEKRTKISREAMRDLLHRIPVSEMGHYESLVKHVSRLAEELLANRMFKGKEKKASLTVRKLVEGYEYHGYPLTYWHLKSMGLQCELLKDNAEEICLEVYKQFLKLQRVLDAVLFPFYASLPKFLAKHAYSVRKLDHGLIVIPAPEESFKYFFGRVVELVESEGSITKEEAETVEKS
ncbi:MAG: hypothetical protein DRJ59_02590 [Thermoprotei archaeon]|nr:MAG: hypothetical protein DRJ59_02590 [Thermoprotei archaeon]